MMHSVNLRTSATDEQVAADPLWRYWLAWMRPRLIHASCSVVFGQLGNVWWQELQHASTGRDDFDTFNDAADWWK